VGMRFLIASIASMAIAAQAAPILFVTSSYDTDALAIAGGTPDFNSGNSPPTALPLVSSATVVAPNGDFATASGLGSPGLLTSYAEADSFAATPSADGESDFVGTIAEYGKLNLILDFDSLNISGATGDLFVLLTNSISGTLVNADENVSGTYPFEFTIPEFGVTTLELTLFSDATTTAVGQSFINSSQVTINGASSIPLPATPFLLIAGLGAMLAARRKGTNAAA
jgi:hypothetical protein